MDGRRMRMRLALVLGVLCLAAQVQPVAAQQGGASVELQRVVGRVEILRSGQVQWLPAVVGSRLVEGDGIRAFSGASAELAFPDTSTVLLAENSRLLMSKLEFNQQQQSRLVLLHLVVGKVRAAIAQTAITLARARQSNFAITTPTAVAAARGTIAWVFHSDKTWMAVEPEPGLRFQPRIECIPLAGTIERKRQMVLAGEVTRECNPPEPTPPQFLTLANPDTAGFNLGALVTPPSTANVLALITSTPPTTSTQPGFSPNPPPVGISGPPSFNEQPPAAPACATDPCPPS